MSIDAMDIERPRLAPFSFLRPGHNLNACSQCHVFANLRFFNPNNLTQRICGLCHQNLRRNLVPDQCPRCHLPQITWRVNPTNRDQLICEGCEENILRNGEPDSSTPPVPLTRARVVLIRDPESMDVE